MANEVDFSEILITPVATMIREIAAGVAAAQRALDQASLQSQADLHDKFPELEQAGYQVTWYQIPEVRAEMRMAVHLERQTPQSPLRLYATPFNAKYRNAMNFTADGSSTLTLRIVPVPPITPVK